MADIKFSALPKATTSKDGDELAILQDGVNKMIPSPVLESKIINKTVTRVIDQGGASLNVVNLKGVVPTYADLATITPTPEINDAYQVEADGLVYVYTESGFQSEGDGFVVQPEPIGIVEKDNFNAVSGDEVYFKSVNPLVVGLNRFRNGDNISKPIYNTDFKDSNVWKKGYLSKTNTVVEDNNWFFTKEYYPIKKGLYKIKIYNTANTNTVVYNEDLDPILYINSTASDVYKEFEVVTDGFIRFSKTKVRENEKNTLITLQDIDGDVTEDVFLFSDTFNLFKEENSFSKIDVNEINKQFNFLNRFNSENIDSNYFEKGFYNEQGNLIKDNGFITNRTYERVTEGIFNIKTWFGGSACILVFDRNFNILKSIKNNNVNGVFDEDVVFPSGSFWVKIPFRIGSFPNEKENISMKVLSNSFFQVNRDYGVLDEIDDNNSESAVNSKSVKKYIQEYTEYTDYSKHQMPIISLVSDDLHNRNKDWFIPLLEENNVFGTFACITGFFDNPVEKDNYFTRKEVIELHKKGHDVVSHTVSHERDLHKQNSEKITFELLKSKLDLQELGINTRGYIAPFGERNAKLDEIVRRYYDWNTITNGGLMSNIPPINRLNLQRFPFDGVSYQGRPKLEVLKERIDECFNSKGWLIITIHPQYGEYLNEARKAEYQEMIDYIRSKPINILTISEGYDYYKNIVQMGDIGIDEERIVGMNGEVNI